MRRAPPSPTSVGGGGTSTVAPFSASLGRRRGGQNAGFAIGRQSPWSVTVPGTWPWQAWHMVPGVLPVRFLKELDSC